MPVNSTISDVPPLVTVIICAYNAGSFLRPSLQSILDQSYANLEIILVDDGSSDGSMDSIEKIKDSRIRLLRQENRGKPLALNRALDLMTGDFYAVHDADDISHPQRIEKQLQRMLDEPDLGAVFCGHDIIIGTNRYAPRFREKGPQECKKDIMGFTMPGHDPTAMYRVALVGEFAYDPKFRIGQGYDYVMRVGERHPMAVVGECLYSYRINWTSATRRNPEERISAIQEVIRSACERRSLNFDEIIFAKPDKRGQNSMLDNGVATNFMESVIDLRRAGRWTEAISNAISCVRLQPLDPHYYKPLVYVILPDGIRRRLRPSERSR